MNFLYLEEVYREWNDILVIGKTIERYNKKSHIIGMTLEDELKLYIIEPYNEPENFNNRKKGVCNQRKILKEQENEEDYLDWGDIYFGNVRLQVQESLGSPLKYINDYGEIQLFFEMMKAGWVIPEWLKNEEWDNLQLTTIEFADVKKIPNYSKEMPIIIKHNPNPIQHILEKTITLNVGKSHAFSFTDNYDDKVQCYINNVFLINVWEDMEKQFSDPQYTEKFLSEQLQEIKKHCFRALEQSCPKGMYYIGLEYECSKDLKLQFYTKEYLKSFPEEREESVSILMMNTKPDKEIGIHNLPLKSCVIQTAVTPDTSKISAELFSYFEKVDAWEEEV